MGPLQGIYLQGITQTQGIIRISPGPDGIGILDPNSSDKINYIPYKAEPPWLSQESKITTNTNHTA
jgi:phage terminase large subunit-like protein